MELLTATQMRAIEQAAIDSGEVTGLELMERAGRGVVEAVFEEWPEMDESPGKAVVLCGPGNNGGDGFVVARLLKEKGWAVDVYLHGDEAKLSPDASENCRRWREMGGGVTSITAFSSTDGRKAALFVDALFGTGLTRPFVMPATLEAVLCLSRPKTETARVVCIDMPSGFCADSGKFLSEETEDPLADALRGDLTVAFHRPKVGHYIGDGPLRSGALRVADIGLGPCGPVSEFHSLMERPSDWAIDRTLRKSGHKYDAGHALVLSGGAGKGGAARLAARAALRIGAGLVTIGAPNDAIAEHAARLDAVMLKPAETVADVENTLADGRFRAVVIGPGHGVDERTRAMASTALTSEGVAVVLDADALTVFGNDPEALFAMTRDRPVVLTPHMGEFARLFPDLAARLTETPVNGPAFSKAAAAAEAAARARCVVLLKGADTVIGEPPPRGVVPASGWAVRIVAAHYQRACPWLATAGAGDVLAGMIGGLLARRLPPLIAAETAAWLHQEAARKFGPGLIAEDLPEQLPAVFRDLGVS